MESFEQSRDTEIKKSNIEYRSPGLEHGALNRIGVPHVHIDGAKDQPLVLDIVKELEAKGDLGKLNNIIHSVGGKQRIALPEVYDSHTPAIEGEELLDFFSSNIVKDRADAVSAVDLISSKVKDVPGVIVELEQVVGWYDARGWKWIEPKDEIEPINPEEVSSTPQPTWPYEIHHGFNVPKTSEDFPIPLEKLVQESEEAGLIIGGWFVFDKGNEWAYRSNSFSQAEGIKDLVKKEQEALNFVLNKNGFDNKARTLVERVLGIWKSNDSKNTHVQ